MGELERPDIQIYDPASATLVGSTYQRTPFANNQIPQSRFDPVSKEIMAYAQPLAQPNIPGLVPGTSAYVRNNAVSYGTSQFPSNKHSIKGDQVITSKQRIGFLFGRTREQDLGYGSSTPTLPIPLSGNPGYNRSDVYRLSYDYTLSPTWLNRFYAGGNNWRQNHGAYSRDLHTQLARLQPQFSHHQLFAEALLVVISGPASRTCSSCEPWREAKAGSPGERRAPLTRGAEPSASCGSARRSW